MNRGLNAAVIVVSIQNAMIVVVSKDDCSTSGVYLRGVKQDPYCFKETLLTMKIITLDGFQN